MTDLRMLLTALVFLAGCMWLYSAILSAVTGRARLGRSAQHVLLAGCAAWVLITGRVNVFSALSIIGVFVMTMILPAFVLRLLHQCMNAGHAIDVQLWRGMWIALTWTFPPEPGQASGGTRRVGLEAEAYSDEGPEVNPQRLQYIEGLLANRQYAEAIQYHESQPPSADPMLFYTMVIPYAETGNLNAAAMLLLRAEEHFNEYSNDMAVRRLAAFMRLYAFCGRANDVADVIRANSRLASRMPRAYMDLWIGVALKRAGDAARGDQTLLGALSRTPSDQPLLWRMIEQRLSESASVPILLSTELAENLARLDRAKQRRVDSASARAWQRVPVTVGLIGACVAMFVITMLLGRYQYSRTLVQFGANSSCLVEAGQFWRLIASMFLHGDGLHILFNMYGLYILGSLIERTAGRWQLLAIFMISGICGSIASAYVGAHVLSVGASGAIFGLLGAALFIALRFRPQMPKRRRLFYLFNLIFVTVTSLALGFFAEGIDNWAHAGGLAAGIVAGYFLWPKPRPAAQWMWRIVGTLSVAVLAIAGAQTAQYAARGSYPRNPLPMQVYDSIQAFGSQERAWTIRVPCLWNGTGNAKGQFEFEDPLGSRMQIQVLPENAFPPVPKNPSLIQAGAYRYYQWQTEMIDNHRVHRTVIHFLRREPDRNYYVTFECIQHDARDFQPLLNAILSTLETLPPLPNVHIAQSPGLRQST